MRRRRRAAAREVGDERAVEESSGEVSGEVAFVTDWNALKLVFVSISPHSRNCRGKAHREKEGKGGELTKHSHQATKTAPQ